MKDVDFWLQLDEDDERFPLTGNITIGRHLDNDLMIAGEDVRDYHARIELTNRGPRVRPLDGANLMVGDVAVEGPRGLMPGDKLLIGHHHLTLTADAGERTIHWALYPPGDGPVHALGDSMVVGRGDDSDLQILEGHISRRHARLVTMGDVVWLADLDSSNGSYVNGERIVGAVRVYHGDELTFDISRFQLIGDHPDLTPIRPFSAEAEAFEIDPQLTGEALPTAEVRPLPVREGREASGTATEGPRLLGIDGGVAGRSFALGFGRQLIGRAPEVDIHLPEPSVSLRHAEIDVRADGVFVTNLISTNGVQVNGADVHIQRLEPGDQVQLGRALLEFQAPARTTEAPVRGTSGRTLGLAVIVAVVAGLLWWWGFG
jgi:pSer/pThr/pTyr-binding forkhead associated (FHA) protein